jgi:hypothetical protein
MASQQVPAVSGRAPRTRYPAPAFLPRVTLPARAAFPAVLPAMSRVAVEAQVGEEEVTPQLPAEAAGTDKVRAAAVEDQGPLSH